MPAGGRQRRLQSVPDPGVRTEHGAGKQAARDAPEGRPGTHVPIDHLNGRAHRVSGAWTVRQPGDKHDSGHMRKRYDNLHRGDGTQPG